MLEELILAVARDASLPAEQAALVVATVLRFFTARLPSSLVGELHARLGTKRPDNDGTVRHQTRDEPESP